VSSKAELQVDISQRTEEEEVAMKKLRALVPDIEPKLVPQVKPVHRV
jgi:hypothetical protein